MRQQLIKNIIEVLEYFDGGLKDIETGSGERQPMQNELESVLNSVKEYVVKPDVMSSQIMDNMQLREQINKNRNEIDKLLSSELPIDIIKFNIEILSARNERFIKQLTE